MDSLFKNLRSGNDGHPSEDQLLLYVDGELTSKLSPNLRAHLEACWSCRVRMEKIEETISTFVDYRNQVLKPLVAPPPRNWSGFDGRLRDLVSQIGEPPIFANLRGSLSRIFFTPNRSGDLKILIRPVAAILLVALTVAVLTRFNRISVVSASEMLERVAAAQQNQIAATPQAVIYQKLQVRRIRTASQLPDTVTWEVWNDTVTSQGRQAIEDLKGRHFLPPNYSHQVKTKDQNSQARTSTTDGSDALTDLNDVLRSNHMNPAMPLSAASFSLWRQSVQTKQEEVTKSKLADGTSLLTLKTVDTGTVKVGAISEGELVVRESDWHPIEERLRVKVERGHDEFELTETAYAVVSLTTLDPAIFGEQSIASASDSPSASDELKLTGAASSPLPVNPSPIAASAELEVEVLRLLNQAGADVSEQIEVSRTADGLLHVKGLVDTDKRKNEIVGVLAPVSIDPAVKIEIETVAEAARREAKTANQSSAAPTVIDRLEVSSGSMPAAADLRRYFAESGGDLDRQISQYASRAINHSQRALFHASALKRLSQRFSPEQVNTLDKNTRSKWLTIIRQHARAVQQESASLRQHLQPVFGTSSVDGSIPIELNSDSDLIAAISRLTKLAAANDLIVRSAFTVSAEPSSVSAIKTSQFAQSLSAAEILAARIGAVTGP